MFKIDLKAFLRTLNVKQAFRFILFQWYYQNYYFWCYALKLKAW
jgi:hypothetical protein